MDNFLRAVIMVMIYSLVWLVFSEEKKNIKILSGFSFTLSPHNYDKPYSNRHSTVRVCCQCLYTPLRSTGFHAAIWSRCYAVDCGCRRCHYSIPSPPHIHSTFNRNAIQKHSIRTVCAMRPNIVNDCYWNCTYNNDLIISIFQLNSHICMPPCGVCRTPRHVSFKIYAGHSNFAYLSFYVLLLHWAIVVFDCVVDVFVPLGELSADVPYCVSHWIELLLLFCMPVHAYYVINSSDLTDTGTLNNGFFMIHMRGEHIAFEFEIGSNFWTLVSNVVNIDLLYIRIVQFQPFEMTHWHKHTDISQETRNCVNSANDSVVFAKMPGHVNLWRTV